MESSNSKLICNLEKSINYLSQKVATEPSYSDLIKTLNSAIDTLKKVKKPIAKIISPSATLATKLKEKNEANQKLRLDTVQDRRLAEGYAESCGCYPTKMGLAPQTRLALPPRGARSLYDFEVIFPLKQPYKIVNNCDVICLVYNSRQNILEAHQRLIKLADKKNISLILVVKQEKIKTPYASLSEWLTAQDCSQINNLLLPLDDFIDLDNPQNIDIYQQYLIQLLTTVKVKREVQVTKEIITKIKRFFKTETTDAWQLIKQIKDTYFQGESISRYQQKNRQVFNLIAKEKQQLLRQIKQFISHSRNDYLNPFIIDSWIFTIQQIIYNSQIKLVKETEETYLYLTVENFNNTEYIHSYILSLCQQKINDALAAQWSKINYVYAGGGLQTLVNKINTELETISPLYTSEIDLSVITLASKKYPTLDLGQIIDPYCLKINSRIIFDYNYVQSSWFRLLISVLVGIGIYLITKLYFGTGKYIGFVILIFQTINLFTGQDIKTLKIKQHKKELQRTVDNKYQNLIRLIVDKLIQTLIITLDQESQLYQQQIDGISIKVNTKLEEIKQTINQHKLRINNLKQDKEKILSWLD